MIRACTLAFALLLAAAPAWAAPPVTTVDPRQSVSASFDLGGEPLTVTSDARFAGAVSSLRFRGQEWVNASDHGRLLQGALNYEGLGECFNPTQGGASSDRGRSTSRRLFAQGADGRFAAVTRMAYWLRPGQACSDGKARNTGRLSDAVYSWALTPTFPGVKGLEVTVVLATEADHTIGVVEALTIYMPPEFSRFLKYDPATGALSPDAAVAAQPGEAPGIGVATTPDGTRAVALLGRSAGATYGRWTYPDTQKLNVVYRPPAPFPAGARTYRLLLLLGSESEVVAALQAQVAK